MSRHNLQMIKNTLETGNYDPEAMIDVLLLHCEELQRDLDKKSEIIQEIHNRVFNVLRSY